ncbi:hypothetical protein [Mucilaginibacter sp.]|uniref:hypothetical protein n=1 Tax=Mucilaginibacter sp. TaxID=1882438 RepID=UPI0032662486
MTIMAVYFVIAVTHILFLPCMTQPHAIHFAGHNSIFKRKTENLNGTTTKGGFLQRPDKSTLEDKKSLIDVLTSVVGFFTLLFFTIQLWKLDLKRYRTFPDPVVSFQYSYLSLCTFRI